MGKTTPMMRQYLDVKARVPDGFLFFRLGDFYELFLEDAKEAARLLEITLTSRADGVPMCGVPYHSAQSYIETLVGLGHKVAICEQMEDPKEAKGVVRREIVRFITPGTLSEGKALAADENRYLASARPAASGYAYAAIDVSTGEAFASFADTLERLEQDLRALEVKELVVLEGDRPLVAPFARFGITISTAERPLARPDLEERLPEAALPASRLLLAYLRDTQLRSLGHLQPFDWKERARSLELDLRSLRNLELLQSARGERKGSLLWLLDETMTAMGARRLKRWIAHPSTDRREIERRLSAVEAFLTEFLARGDVREELKAVYDLERLAGKVGFGNATGRDLAQLRQSIARVPAIVRLLEGAEAPALKEVGAALDACEDLFDMLAQAISDQPPLSLKDAGIIREGYSEELDRLRDAQNNGRDWIAALEREERERTGAKSLKIGYTRVFGYYIELTKSNVHLADESRYIRRQTLANAERFITEELKEKETLILTAEEQALALEARLFAAVRESVKEKLARLQCLAETIGELDVLAAFAEVSERYRFVKPAFGDGRALSIVGGRHPVVEKMTGAQRYVPNDCELDEERSMLLITGPNMSGKSTYMRQVALTCILGQIGCFVPAERAALPIIDKLFTRIGAGDDLSGGQSTFMIEMLESRHAIANATPDSLLLFDEIGRGTSTYDGMALAQSMMEHIHRDIGAKTLFSTHYHELTALEAELPKLRNVHAAAAERDGSVVFLHKVLEGPADESYGIYVAELAGLPETVIARARELLAQFEQTARPPILERNAPPAQQLALFTAASEEAEIAAEVAAVDLHRMTPLAALQAIDEWQRRLRR